MPAADGILRQSESLDWPAESAKVSDPRIESEAAAVEGQPGKESIRNSSADDFAAFFFFQHVRVPVETGGLFVACLWPSFGVLRPESLPDSQSLARQGGNRGGKETTPQVAAA